MLNKVTIKLIKVCMVTKQKGYILFVTFSLLALCTTLISLYMAKGFTHKRLAATLLKQDELAYFATSCIALGQSYLSLPGKDQHDPDEKEKKTDTQNEIKQTLKKILQAQREKFEYNFEEFNQNFPVVINLTFFSESGKININGLYDLVQQKFYYEGQEGKDRKVFSVWLFDRIAEITGKPSLFVPFLEHVKQRKCPFNDVTELLAIKEFSDCFATTVFYHEQIAQEDKSRLDKKIFLTDLFTIATESNELEPWLFSSSVCTLLDIAQKNDKNGILESQNKDIDLSSFKMNPDWQKDWDSSLKLLYGISYEKIPQTVQNVLTKQFASTVFSMMISVVHNDMTVKIFAILKQKRLPNSAVVYDVIKIYQV